MGACVISGGCLPFFLLVLGALAVVVFGATGVVCTRGVRVDVGTFGAAGVGCRPFVARCATGGVGLGIFAGGAGLVLSCDWVCACGATGCCLLV